jgi:uncharacterized protein (DUF2236 family)
MVVPPALTYLIRDYLPQEGMIFPSEAELDQLVLGPESVAWRTTSDVRLNLAMLYPLLLQVAHPTVDAGVADFSE